MFCSKCGIELEEGSAFCSQCGNKIIVDEVAQEDLVENEESAIPSEKETESSSNNNKIVTSVILIAVICVVGYFIGTAPGKAPKSTSENTPESIEQSNVSEQMDYQGYSEEEIPSQTVAEAYADIPKDTYTESNEEEVAEDIYEETYTDTYDDEVEHDYDLLSALYKACVVVSYDPEISDTPPCDSIVTREYFDDSDWGWAVMDTMGVDSLADIEELLKSDRADGTIVIYRDSSGDYNVGSGTINVY